MSDDEQHSCAECREGDHDTAGDARFCWCCEEDLS